MLSELISCPFCRVEPLWPAGYLEVPRRRCSRVGEPDVLEQRARLRASRVIGRSDTLTLRCVPSTTSARGGFPKTAHKGAPQEAALHRPARAGIAGALVPEPFPISTYRYPRRRIYRHTPDHPGRRPFVSISSRDRGTDGRKAPAERTSVPSPVRLTVSSGVHVQSP